MGTRNSIDSAWHVAALCHFLVCGSVLDGYEALHDVFKGNANTEARNARCPPVHRRATGRCGLRHTGAGSETREIKEVDWAGPGSGSQTATFVFSRENQPVSRLSPGHKDLFIDRGGNLAQVHHRHLHSSASAPPRLSCSHSRRRRRCRPAAEMKPSPPERSQKRQLEKRTVLRDVSCEITTRHTSLAAVIVVAPQLDGVVVGRVFLDFALLAVVPLQLLEHPVPRCPDEIALPMDLWAWDKGNTIPQRVACLDSCHKTRLGGAAPTTARSRSGIRTTNFRVVSQRCRAPAACRSRRTRRAAR